MRSVWHIGTPDLIVASPTVEMKALAPDWFGVLGESPTNLPEDRYVAAVEIKEVNDSRREDVDEENGRRALPVSPRCVRRRRPGRPRELVRRLAGSRSGTQRRRLRPGRRASCFRPTPGSSSTRCISTRTGSTRRRVCEVGFKFHPKGYKPKVNFQPLFVGNGPDLDIRGMDANQRMDAYFTLPQHTKLMTFEPHMHAPGVRMCLEAIWGINGPDAQLRRLQPQLGPRLQLRGRRRAAAAERHDPPRHRLLRQLAGEQERGRPEKLVGFGPPLGRQHGDQPDAGDLS